MPDKTLDVSTLETWLWEAATQSPQATRPSSSTRPMEMPLAAWRTARKPGVTGLAVNRSGRGTCPAWRAARSS